MSNFIPMVSSSPPPFDEVPPFDDGWGDEDDEEFGNFTGADSTKHSPNFADFTLPSPDREVPPSPDSQSMPVDNLGVIASQQPKPSHVKGLDFQADTVNNSTRSNGEEGCNSWSGSQQKPSSLDLPVITPAGKGSTNGDRHTSDITGCASPTQVTDKFTADLESPSTNQNNCLTSPPEAERRQRESTTDSGMYSSDISPMCSSDISPVPKSDNTTDFCDSKSSGSDVDEMFTECRVDSSPSSESADQVTDSVVVQGGEKAGKASSISLQGHEQGNKTLRYSSSGTDNMVEDGADNMVEDGADTSTNEQSSSEDQIQSDEIISDGAECTDISDQTDHSNIHTDINRTVGREDKDCVISATVQSSQSVPDESSSDKEMLNSESSNQGSELLDGVLQSNKDDNEETEASNHLNSLTQQEKGLGGDSSHDVAVIDEEEDEDSSSLTARVLHKPGDDIADDCVEDLDLPLATARVLHKPDDDVADDCIEDLDLPSLSQNDDEDSASDLRSESDTDNMNSAELKSESDADNFNSAQSLSDMDNGESDDEFSTFETAPTTEPVVSNLPTQEGFAAFSSSGETDTGDDNWANFEGPSSSSQPAVGFGDFNQNSQVGGKSESQSVEEDDDFGDFSESGFAEPSGSKPSVSDSWASAAGFSPSVPSNSTPMSEQPKLVKKEKLTSVLCGCFPNDLCSWAGLSSFVDQLDAMVDQNILPRTKLHVQTRQNKTPKDVSPAVKNVWMCLRDLEKSTALKYQWMDSAGNKKLFATMKIDARNILMIGNKKQPVPLFATNLCLLEPTRKPLEATKPPQKVDTLVDTSKTETSTAPVTQDIPPAQFDWSTSGLTNPLDAKSTLLNLDLLAVNEAKQASDKLRVFESDLLNGSDQIRAPPKTLQPLESILATMKFNPTMPQLKHDDNLSQEASRIIRSLPDLSFMQAKVLMFPMKAVGENGQIASAIGLASLTTS